MSDPFFDQLNAEIDAAMKRAKRISSGKAARDRASTPFATAADKENWQLQREAYEAETWQSVAIVALFGEEQCDGCGSNHQVFLQFMEQQIEIARPANRRFRRVQKVTQGLPKKVLVHKTTTHICCDCCGDHGFELENATQIKSQTPVIASRFHHSEDINAIAA